MRRSTSVTLVLVPMLAAATVATADPPPEPLSPPGMTEPLFAPPGMVPTIMELRCEDDPMWRLRVDCNEVDIDGTVIRGGFGGYFWTGSGRTGG